MSSVLEFPASPSLTVAVDELEAAVGTVAELVADGWLESLSTDELLATTVRLQSALGRLQAVAVAAASEVREADAGRSAGFTATTRWLEVHAGLSPAESRGVVSLGERLQDEFVATRDAWLDGEISAGAAREITTGIPRTLKGLGLTAYETARTRLEGLALRAARDGATVSQLRRVISRAAFALDPAGAERAVLAARDAEFLRFTPTASGVDVRGFLSTESAALVLAAFDQKVDSLHRTGTLAAEDGQALESPSRGQRVGRREHLNARVLIELVGRLLDDGLLGSKHAQRPHLTVTVHRDDYVAGLGGEVLLPGFGPVPVPASSIDRILCDAEIHPVLTQPGREDLGRTRSTHPGSAPPHTGPPWEPAPYPWLLPVPEPRWDPSPDEIARDTDIATVVELSDDLDDHVSFWRRLVGEPGRHVLDVGRSFRSATPKIRRALSVRDGGCVAPGCGVDPSRCEAHHVDHWEDGGDTALGNLVLLCSRHHHLVHEGGLRIELDPAHEPGDPAYVRLLPARR